MRAIIQRVEEASVIIAEKEHAHIKHGYLVFVAIERMDQVNDISYMVRKILSLRLFPNSEGRTDKNLIDVDGELLLVSQFTLYGDVRKGRRPDFFRAAPPDMAEELYYLFVNECAAQGLRTSSGIFATNMKVQLINDGPYTILLDSKKEF